MTVWTPDVTNLAGSKQLVTSAAALTACEVSSGILLFTTNDVHMMSCCRHAIRLRHRADRRWLRPGFAARGGWRRIIPSPG